MKIKLVFICFLYTFNLLAQWQTVDLSNFSKDAGTSNQRIAIDSNNTIYIAYRHNSFKLNVIRFDGNNWSYLGGPEITSAQVGPHVDIKVNSNNIPYVVYKDNNTPNQKLSVIRYISNTWETVGSSFFTPGIANSPKIAFDNNDVPYVVFEDFVEDRTRLSVMKFNDTAWELVGDRGFSNNAAYTSIVIDKNNHPIVAFASTANGNAGKTSVMKFNGTTWEFVGEEGFATGFSRNHSLSIDSKGTIYVAYHASGTNGGSSNVLKFNGTTWEHLGTPGMGFFATEQELFIDINDIVYLSCTETTKNEIQVRNYHNSSWNLVGNSSLAIGNFSNLVKDTNNNLFVAYSGTSTLDVKKITDVVLSTNTKEINKNEFSIFPNPASNFITISSNIAIKNIEIFSALGKRVLQRTSKELNDNTIDISNFASGIYLLKINNKQFKKLIIN
jgi:hypothetical protein